ncbi:hypothetical protein FGADI_5369 [Fusarium gaditjirri]|uniref:Uncharacterized protein n=1 Tax=Fusarium gaditjirri TaxID=282569 RepID=A0A8H4TAJ3_9HYPO|nr:hypothetical protein FGADI_5369 [Fusarium gaditjirri]
MWGNIEVRDLVEYMRSYNSGLNEQEEAAGFYGLGLYSMGTSMKSNLTHWADDAHEYGPESLAASFRGYENDVIAMLKDIQSQGIENSAALDDGTEFRSGEQNATVVKAIVWAYNSHVGDAQATSMGWSREELNIGQLCKKRFGVQALGICTGTNTGTVAATQDWDGNMNIIELLGSHKELMHAAGINNFPLDLRKGKCDEKVRET